MIFSPAGEELDIEFNSRFDYVSEAYGATARDCNQMAEDDARYEDEEFWKPQQHAFGPYVYQKVPLHRRGRPSAPGAVTPGPDCSAHFGPFAPLTEKPAYHLPHGFPF